MPLFTKENAATMGKLGAEVRWHSPEPEPTIAILPPMPEKIAEPSYQELRLLRMREQLDRIDKLMLEEEDPQRLSWLATASMRLSDQEFALAGRSKPGNTRPVAKPSVRKPSSLGPIGLSST